jgi:uncharacterized membrane protein YkgB
MSSSMLTPSFHSSSAALGRRAEILRHAGLLTLRYGLVFLLVLWGAFKFTAFEAEGIRPLIEHSPFLGWMYSVLGIRSASAVIGVVEVATGLAIASRRWLPAWSGLASVAASVIFLLTLSFLFTTPGVLEPTSPMGGFLMKDLLLLGASLLTAGEALAAAQDGTDD